MTTPAHFFIVTSTQKIYPKCSIDKEVKTRPLPSFPPSTLRFYLSACLSALSRRRKKITCFANPSSCSLDAVRAKLGSWKPWKFCSSFIMDQEEKYMKIKLEEWHSYSDARLLDFSRDYDRKPVIKAEEEDDVKPFFAKAENDIDALNRNVEAKVGIKHEGGEGPRRASSGSGSDIMTFGSESSSSSSVGDFYSPTDSPFDEACYNHTDSDSDSSAYSPTDSPYGEAGHSGFGTKTQGGIYSPTDSPFGEAGGGYRDVALNESLFEPRGCYSPTDPPYDASSDGDEESSWIEARQKSKKRKVLFGIQSDKKTHAKKNKSASDDSARYPRGDRTSRSRSLYNEMRTELKRKRSKMVL